LEKASCMSILSESFAVSGVFAHEVLIFGFWINFKSIRYFSIKTICFFETANFQVSTLPL
jgi:hypothetical protein